MRAPQCWILSSSVFSSSLEIFVGIRKIPRGVEGKRIAREKERMRKISNSTEQRHDATLIRNQSVEAVERRQNYSYNGVLGLTGRLRHDSFTRICVLNTS